MSTRIITTDIAMIPCSLNRGKWHTLGIKSGTKGKKIKWPECIVVEVQK